MNQNSKSSGQSKLTDGLIPSGSPCPFIGRCSLKNVRCPGFDGKMKPVNFSCAAARGFDLIETDNG